MILRYWAVFWIDASSKHTAEAGYIAAVSQFDRAPRCLDEALNVFSRLQHKWLIILDNASDATCDYNEMLPVSKNGAVLVNSRNAGYGEQLQTVGQVQLEGLDDVRAFELVFVKSGESEVEDTKRLVALLRGNPLAIKQARTYLVLSNHRNGEHVDVFLPKQPSWYHSTLLQGWDEYSHVYRTSEVCVDALDVASPVDEDARDLFAFLSKMHHSGFPVELFKAAQHGFSLASSQGDGDATIDTIPAIMLEALPRILTTSFSQPHDDEKAPLQKAISRLRSLGLVDVEERRGLQYLSVQPLVHSWAKSYFAPKDYHPDKVDQTWLAAGTFWTLVHRSGRQQHRWASWATDVRAHLVAFLTRISPRAESTTQKLPLGHAHLLWHCAALLYDAGHYGLCEFGLSHIFFPWDEQAPPRPCLLPLYELQAQCEERCGRWASAQHLYERIVPVKTERLGPDHPEVLQTRHALAVAAREAGDVDRAISELWDVRLRRLALCHSNDEDLLAAQLDLAVSLILNGGRSLLLPITLLYQVVKIHNTRRPADDLVRLRSRAALARAYLKTADWAGMTNRSLEGITMLEDVSQIEKASLHVDNLQRVVTLRTLAGAYSATGRTDAAEISRLLEVVEIQDTLVTPTQQTDKVSSLLQLGRVCRNRDPEAGVMNLFKEISAYRKLEAKGKREQEPSQPWQVQCREDFYLMNLIQKAMEIARLEPDTKDID